MSQRYDVYLNNGTPRKEGKWIKSADYIKEILDYKKLIKDIEKNSDNWEKLARDTREALDHSYKVNFYLSFLCFTLGFIIYNKESIVTFYHGLSL